MVKRAFQGRFDQEIIHGIQVYADTINLYQAAGVYNLFTATNQDLWLDGFAIRLPNVDVSDDASITSIAIATDDETAVTILSSGDGATANLTAEKQFVWTTGCLLKAGSKVELTIAGGAADASTVCDYVAIYRPVAMGGYLVGPTPSESPSVSPSVSPSSSPSSSPSVSPSSSPSVSPSVSPSSSPSVSPSSSPSVSPSSSPSVSPSVSPSSSPSS